MDEATREKALFDQEANEGFVELVLSAETSESPSGIEEGFLTD